MRALSWLWLALLIAAPAASQDSADEPPESAIADPPPSDTSLAIEPAVEQTSETAPSEAAAPETAEDEQEIRPGPVAFSGPQFRLGFHVSAGAILNRPHWGGFGGLDLVIGARVTREWSVIARVDVALGGWRRQGPRFINGVGGGLGVEHIAFRAFGVGTALAIAVTGGVWLPDECRGGSCLFLAPMLDASLAYLTNMNREPANPLAAWSIGISGGIGYDVANEEFAGRAVFFVGHDVSL
jgi:hypothetical protein